MVPEICRCLTLQAEPDVRRLLELERRRAARCQRLGRRHTPTQGLRARRETLLLRYVARHRIHDDQNLPVSERQAARPHSPRAVARLRVIYITPGSARLHIGPGTPRRTTRPRHRCLSDAAVKQPASGSLATTAW